MSPLKASHSYISIDNERIRILTTISQKTLHHHTTIAVPVDFELTEFRLSVQIVVEEILPFGIAPDGMLSAGRLQPPKRSSLFVVFRHVFSRWSHPSSTHPN